MGGLFSSTPKEQPPIAYQNNFAGYHQDYYEEELRYESIRQAQIDEAAILLRQKTKRLREENEEKNRVLRYFVSNHCQKVYVQNTLFNLWNDAYFNTYIAVQYVTLPDTHWEYICIKRLISNKKNFKIDRIEKIENPILKKAYDLKKEQKRRRFPQVQEREMFHGTKSSVVDNICTFNFDWRSVKEHKFGKGISFSSNSTYASVYSDECYNKIMLVAKVLIGNSCPGNKFMEIPSDQFDTSMKSTPQEPQCNDIVTVKYDDCEFYPAYKIHYHLLVDNRPRKSSNNRRNAK